MRIALIFALAGVAEAAGGQALVDRVGTTGFVQLQAESFKALSPRQQSLAFYLSQASIAIDPINYDQNSRFGLRQKRLLEALVNLPPDGRMQILNFTKLFWANRGNHNEMTAQKFMPEFTFDQLKAAATQALKAGRFKGTPYGTPAIQNQADLDRELEDLRPSLFDPNFEPMITAKSPQGGKDILQSSANNFYLNVSMEDLANFHDTHPLNSRLVKKGRQTGGRGLPRRHARWQSAARHVRTVPAARPTDSWKRRGNMPNPARTR